MTVDATAEAREYRDWNGRLATDAVAIVDRARDAGVEARVLGGLGILLHDAQLQEQGGSRMIGDIDLIVPAGQHRAISGVLEEAGYRSEERFNALNGHRRMVFKSTEWDLDVLVGWFEMCHRIDMGPRFELDYPTLPVTDLLLTKLQIVKLNSKDASDIADLLASHEVRKGTGDWVDLDRLESVTRADWGLWRTITGTLRAVADLGHGPVVTARATQLVDDLEQSPKSTKWKIRARVGERLPWYVLPDEVNQ